MTPVRTGRDRRTFIDVPWPIYADDPAWVPPLRIERQDAFSPRQPFCAHAELELFIAWRGGRAVGRISAQLDRLYEQTHGERVGWFGALEGEDDPVVFAALVGAAEAWLAARGATRVVGPFTLGINQETGLLVEGFETPPFVMNGHARRWYGPHLEAAGYRPVQDMLQYQVTPGWEMPKVVQRLLGGLGGRVTVRPLDRRRIGPELETMRDIFNDAWSGNWGFVPWTEAEFAAVGREMLLILQKDFAVIAELDGEPVAFIVLLPNLNEVIRDLDGRLLPFGWARLLWRLKVKTPRTARVPLMGVRRRFHHTRLGPALAYAVIEAAHQAALRCAIHTVELGWVLESNSGMRSIIEAIGGTVTKRYRCYSRDLATAAAARAGAG